MACYSVQCKPHMSHTAIEYDCKDHHISLCFSFVNTLIGGGVIDTVWGQFRLKLVFYLFTRRHLPPSFCRPQTKLWEGTIFTIHRRLSVHKALVKGVGNMHHGIGHMVGYPPPKKGMVVPLTLWTSDLGPLAGGIWWWSLETRSNFFILGLPRSNIWWWPLKLKHKRAVCILLESFLVITNLEKSSTNKSVRINKLRMLRVPNCRSLNHPPSIIPQTSQLLG